MPGFVVGKLEVLPDLPAHVREIGRDQFAAECFQPCGEIVGNGNLPFVAGLGDVRRNGDGPRPHVHQLRLASLHALQFVGTDAGEIEHGERADHHAAAPAGQHGKQSQGVRRRGRGRFGVLFLADLTGVEFADALHWIRESERAVAASIRCGGPCEETLQRPAVNLP